ncbi:MULTISPECIES: phosphoribosylformylglycinamidine synthase subunit PurL [Candidatus Nitrosocaldus]|jgi:phosphoribosylformylglycinamidine synthase|uniref:Phosphoribosylformylglycinamidine synthase subunit PurL n=1 Tax=Candidatus Nitrosocaldus cavascurensis TaxID=2058097 RepID=A0A2K5AQV0_9ARCH|nr:MULTISPECIES: phosphoribosylformylglycinamidine synthase subunit PurL [Candidatus Nitrosocaldus]SPC34020.1 Phosphoribosylformylglycinamidine synthase subunit PurL [Candidatus Nitrosocaldus cavascurensis]
MSLTDEEIKYLKDALAREPNSVELSMVSAEWSEHCSYKSSKPYLKMFSTEGRYVLIGPGYDAGVLDIGDGMLLTLHIESHNHPSAVEPYGGAATGIGGVIRDILSMGSRPIALLNALRFGDIRYDNHARWLFRNVVRGIADYGNCIGVPTVAGEVEFDDSFTSYCLVDVACIGIARKDRLVMLKGDADDLVIIAGNRTGRDGIHGASFASRAFEGEEEDRSAVQIPDPFMGKLLIDATMECVEKGCVKAIKDLGGGGLACCLSETADRLGKGMLVTLDALHLREDMSAEEIMISESQERMLYIVEPSRLEEFKAVMAKYEIPYSILGRLTDDGYLSIYHDGKQVARIKASIVAKAPIARRNAKKPPYIEQIARNSRKPEVPEQNDIAEILLELLADPSIASKEWVYRQYDHEVGLRTVVKPGYADAAVLRVGLPVYDRDDGAMEDGVKYIAVKVDGNSKHCYIDPYNGSMGCFSEACRNVACVGAEPIAMVDHLQFGSPEDEHVFWTFVESVRGLADYGRYMGIPCVGGKVSFYNETRQGAIKPTPLVCIVGLVEDGYGRRIMNGHAGEGDLLMIIGLTKEEMGGSEYYEYIHSILSADVPRVDLEYDKHARDALLALVRAGLVTSAHDCSKGGLAVAIAEMCIASGIGARVDLSNVPHTCTRLDDLLFSESHSRFLVSLRRDDLDAVNRVLADYPVHRGVIGAFNSDSLLLEYKGSSISISMDSMLDSYSSIARLMGHGG